MSKEKKEKQILSFKSRQQQPFINGKPSAINEEFIGVVLLPKECKNCNVGLGCSRQDYDTIQIEAE